MPKPSSSRSKFPWWIPPWTPAIETIISITQFEVAFSGHENARSLGHVSSSYWCIRLASYSCSKLPDVRQINPDTPSESYARVISRGMWAALEIRRLTSGRSARRHRSRRRFSQTGPRLKRISILIPRDSPLMPDECLGESKSIL